MSYITSTQGRPIQGVSQQPDKVRIAGQCTESVNFRPDVVRGLVTRPGTIFEGKLDDIAFPDNIKWHYYDRGTGEEYFMSVSDNGNVRVWRRDGTEQAVAVTDADASTYLQSDNARENIQAQTIGDVTFLVNKSKQVSASTGLTSEGAGNVALIYVQYITYGQKQAVKVDLPGGGAATVWYKAPTGSHPDHVEGVRPSFAAERLRQAMEGWSKSSNGPYPGSGFTGVDWGTDYAAGTGGISDNYDFGMIAANVIQIKRKDGSDFKISSTDDSDGNNLIVVKGSVSEISKLPPVAPAGMLVEIDPPGSKDKNANFWLKAEPTNGDRVSWVEAPAPGIVKGADPATMPVQLVRTGVIGGISQFSLELAPWEERRVGDDRTNPLPTFIDTDIPQRIQSIGIFQNRLFFTSGEAVVMTRSGRFYDFFRESAQVATDTDPIDIYADAAKVNILQSSIPFDGDLVFFSENGQFLLLGQDAVSSSNATMIQTTSFESNLSVPPVASGENIFFAFDYGKFTGVREYFTDSVTDTKRARPVTDHVNQYIEGAPLIMASSTSLNMLVIRTADVPNTLYVYEWLWQGNEKVQSAWGKWVFGDDAVISDVRFNTTDLLLVIRRGNGTVVERIDLGDPIEYGLDYQVRLDGRFMTPMAWNQALERWEMDDPYPDESEEDIVLVRADACPNNQGCNQPGLAISFIREGGLLVTYEDIAESDQSPVNVVIGLSYLCTYTPTNPVAKDQNGEAMNLDRLTVGKYHVTYDRTGDVEAVVTNQYDQSRTYQYGNRTMGGPENLVGYAPLVPGQHVIPIRRKANTYTLELRTKDHRPFEVRDFQFDGVFSRRGRRI